MGSGWLAMIKNKCARADPFPFIQLLSTGSAEEPKGLTDSVPWTDRHRDLLEVNPDNLPVSCLSLLMKLVLYNNLFIKSLLYSFNLVNLSPSKYGTPIENG